VFFSAHGLAAYWTSDEIAFAPFAVLLAIVGGAFALVAWGSKPEEHTYVRPAAIPPDTLFWFGRGSGAPIAQHPGHARHVTALNIAGYDVNYTPKHQYSPQGKDLAVHVDVHRILALRGHQVDWSFEYAYPRALRQS
jgi:hypothetical protein